MSNPIVELPDGTLIDVRAIYKIDVGKKESYVNHPDRYYYDVHYIDGNHSGIYEHAFPRAKFVEIWKACVMDLKTEPIVRKPARRIEVE